MGSVGDPGPQGPQGPAGAQGPAGLSGWVLISESFTSQGTVSCPAGKRPLSGGFSASAGAINNKPSFFGWFVSTSVGSAVTGYVICVASQ